MAAKDADLATDHADRSVYLSNKSVAGLEIISVIQVNQETELPELFLVELGEFVTGVTYRMRGYDTTLSSFVFWSSSEVDMDGNDYAGPGPLIDIVVRSVSGD